MTNRLGRFQLSVTRLRLSLCVGASVFACLSTTPALGKLPFDPFLEPFVGFGRMQVAPFDSFYSDYAAKDTSDGFFLGVKAGLRWGQFFVVADYHTSGPFQFSRLVEKAEMTDRMLGFGGGMDFQVIRFWGSYYPDARINDSKNQNDYRGTALKVGFGLPVVKKINANFDFVQHQIKERRQPSATEAFDRLQIQLVLISLSFLVD